MRPGLFLSRLHLRKRHGQRNESVKRREDAGRYRFLYCPRPKNHQGAGLLETPYTADLLLADGRRIRARLFLAEVEVKGRRGPAFVAELNVPTLLLGVHALETLGFKVNPRTGEVEEISPEGGYLL
jgi:hypothetical protein